MAGTVPELTPVVTCPGVTRICTGIVCNCQLALVTSHKFTTDSTGKQMNNTNACAIECYSFKSFKRFLINSGKIGVTPSVAAPGDTHPSDATVCDRQYVLKCTILQLKFQKFQGSPDWTPMQGRGYGTPLQTPSLCAPAFAPPAPRSWPSARQLYVYVPEWRNQKLATLLPFPALPFPYPPWSGTPNPARIVGSALSSSRFHKIVKNVN